MRFTAIFSVAIFVSGTACAGSQAPSSFDAHVPGTPSTSTVRAPAIGLTAATYNQVIDHSAASGSATFAQRYWVDSEYASGPDAPVLYHICGEGNVDQSYFLTDNVTQWAQALGARVVFLEHRYYGQSQPFTDLSAAHLRYLSLDNVLADLASFQTWITVQNAWTGQWISVGGSYSGTLSALYRQRHPELVVGALASSAPMISGVGEQVGSQDDVASLSSEEESPYDGSRQWVYQACTTFGFWEADGPQAGASLQNPSSWLCQQLFGSVALVNSTSYNQSYDQPFLANTASSPNHILFTYGSDDVWTAIGLAQQSNANQGITIQIIPGAGHHFDLNAPTDSDSADVIAARQQFVLLAKQWLGPAPRP